MKTALVFLLLVTFTNAFPLAFEKGKQYIFKYRTEVVHSMPGGASKQIGLRLRCDCHVTMIKMEEAQIKLKNAQLVQLEVSRSERETPIEAVPQAIAQLQQHPVEVVFTDGGQVKAIRVSQNDPEWSRNIKRGIANMLQIAPKAEGQDPKQVLSSKTPVVITQKEPTIVGHCPVVYSVVPQVVQGNQKGSQVNACHVTKTIQYENCFSRPSIKESIFLGHLCPSCQKSLGYVPYLRHAGQVEAILHNRFLLKAMAEEHHVFTPMSELAGQVVATVRQQLQYHLASTSRSSESIESQVETGLTFKLVHPEEEVRQNQAYKAQIKAKVMQLLQQLQNEAQKDISGYAVPKIVAELVAHLRLCDETQLENALDEMLKTKDETIKELCVDALSLAGTKEFALLLKKRIADLSPYLLRRVMISLVFVPRVQPVHVDTLLDICENVQAVKNKLWLRRQCLLSYGAVVNRLARNPEAQQSTQAKLSLNTAIQTLKTKVKQATRMAVKLMYLKAIGNAGFPEHQATIVRLLLNTKLQTGLRVECVWALRKMVRMNKNGLRRKLIQVFANPNNDPELRMAVVAVLLDKQPTFLNMQLLLNIVRRELQSKGPRSNQVASWVISKLSSMAFYDNNIIKDRARRARLALRFAPSVQFGFQYSKAMRIARFSEKLLSGFEMDVNKMNVPQSNIPRNTNTRMRWHIMGYRLDVLEMGARVEGLENVIQDLVSMTRSRQKRSIWTSVMGFFESDSKAAPTSSARRARHSTRSRSTIRSRTTTLRPTKPSSVEFDSVPKKAEVSMFMKMFGQEILYSKMTRQTIEELVGQIKSLILGEKDEIHTAFGAMKITKDSIVIKQRLTKAFLFAHARQLVPTLAGLPLHLHLVSSFVTDTNNNIQIKVIPSLFKILQAKGLTTSMDVKTKICAFNNAFIQVHTPFVRVGLKMQNFILMKPQIGLGMDARFGHSYKFKMQNPTQVTDVLAISPDPNNSEAVGICGIVQIQQAQQFKITEQEVPLKIFKQHIMQLEKTCYGEATTGVETCLYGRVPDLSSLRFKGISLLPVLAQTRLHVQSTPKDQAKQIEIQVDIKQNTKENMIGEIMYKANGKSAKREVPISFKYDYNKNQLVMSVAKKQPLTWGMNLQVDFKRMTHIEASLMFNGQREYKWTLRNIIDRRTGKQMTTTLGWNQLPEYLQEVLSKWEPQILYFVQLFGSISTLEKSKKKIEVTFNLLSPLTGQLSALSPLGRIQSNKFPLFTRVSRLPLSLMEILETPFGQCKISSISQHEQRIAIFDQKSYAISNRQQSTCQHILLQDKDANLVKVAVQVKKNGQLQLIIRVQQPRQTTIVVKPNLSVLINNMPCKEKVCIEQGIGRVLRREQRVKIKLYVKHFIEVKYQRTSIKILASPSLRDRVRGLCGDYNGEEYQELKNPKGKILNTIDEFVRSWRTGC